MRFTALAVVSILGLAFAASLQGPANAQADADIKACRSAQNPDDKIAACARLLAGRSKLQANDTATYLNNRGAGYFAKGNFRRAIADYDEAIKIDDRRPVFFENRAMAYYRLEDWPRTIESYNDALRLDPANRISIFNRANAYRQSGDCARAIAGYTRFIGITPDHGPAYTYRGFCHEQVKQKDAALADYNRAIELDREDADALNNRGVLSVDRGDYRAAIRDLSEALRHMPENAKTWFNRGVAHRENGDLDLAVADFSESLKRNPVKIEAYIDRGIALARLGRDAQAIEDMKRALQIEPDSIRATNLVARIYAKSGVAPSSTSAKKVEAPRRTGKHVALVIGNGNYSLLSKLQNATNDAEDVAKALRDLGFEVVAGHNLGHRDMQTTLRDFARKLDDASLALMFYAGHGVQVNGRNYLVPVDAKMERQSDLALDAIDVAQAIAAMESEKRVNLVFLDACRDNPLTRAPGSGAARSPGAQPGLAAIKNTAGTLIAFSTQPDNVALDGDGRNSPFAAAFLKHVATPRLEIEAMMKLIRADVIAATDGKQVPWGHSSLIGDVHLNAK